MNHESTRAAQSPEYLSVDMAGHLTGLSPWTWRRKAYRGEIASVKAGSRLLIPRSEVDRVMSEGLRPRAAKDESPEGAARVA